MPGLPDHPDLDQLRRQARELLRAAVSEDPAAVARIGAVSTRMTLSAAQQALAQEYGCRNWAALRGEVERRRSPLERWSFGGAAAIETGVGRLLPEALVVGDDDALLFSTVIPWDASTEDEPGSIDDEIRALKSSTRTDDIAVADDQGRTYALSPRETSGTRGPSPKLIRFGVDPIPGQSVDWIELQGRNGTTARLVRSPRAVVRFGRLRRPDPPSEPTTAGAGTPVTARPAARSLPDPDLYASSDTADLTDGAGRHCDLGVTLPTLDGITLELDSLFSTLSGWSLRLRATPRWFRYRDDGNRKWSPVTIRAEDDRDHSYSPSFGGSAGRNGHEYVSLQFSPRLDPCARRLRLTCTSSTGQISVDVDLPAPIVC
jgi:hypothetical protein